MIMNFAMISGVYSALEQSGRPMSCSELAGIVLGNARLYGRISTCCTVGCELGSLLCDIDPKTNKKTYRINPDAPKRNEFANYSAMYTTLEQSDHPMTTLELSKVAFDRTDPACLVYVARQCKVSAHQSLQEAGGIAHIGIVSRDGQLVNLWGVRRFDEAPIQPVVPSYPEMIRVTAEDMANLRVRFRNYHLTYSNMPDAILMALERSNRLMTSREIASVYGRPSDSPAITWCCEQLIGSGEIELAGKESYTDARIWRREMVLL